MLNLTSEFYNLIDEGYIYDTDENGMNMSYGEYAEIMDYFYELIENELSSYYDFESALEAYNDIIATADDDTKMFMGYSDEDDYFYFDIDRDNGTYTYDGKCPNVLKDRFEEFKNTTDLEFKY